MRRGIEASEAHHPAVVREGTCRPLHLRDTTALSIARLAVETEDASFRLLSTAPVHAGSVGKVDSRVRKIGSCAYRNALSVALVSNCPG